MVAQLESGVAPLAWADPGGEGIDEQGLERLYARIEAHIALGWYPGAALAMARRGKLVASRVFGDARLADGERPAVAADDDTLWLLYSQTKPIVSAAVWVLVEQAKLRFHDRIAEYVPEFARHGKEAITLAQVLTHQAGFPAANVEPAAWADHALMREQVCDFTLEWTPGSKVAYHGAAAHWVQATLIEAVTGEDYRGAVRRLVLDPLGIEGIQIGVPDPLHRHLAGAYERAADGSHVPLPERNRPAFWRAGVPGGGGYATVAGMAAFYQALLGLGALNGRRILGPRTVQHVTRNHTGERIDERFGMPMHRGLGVHVRGTTPTVRRRSGRLIVTGAKLRMPSMPAATSRSATSCAADAGTATIARRMS